MSGKQRLRDDSLGEVLLEFQVFGASTRVAAIHVASNTEVQVTCPTSYTTFTKTQAAIRKLRYVLSKT
ncbi:MAG: hypothetical protein VR70_10410 [Rhodospirillaceae bacterium BRH_c57]|nr:MAG: hypothetical protein VR70_10410 [Rhodospirillaceae bacterium BRH_c57]